MENFDFIEMKIPAKTEYIGVVRLSLSGVAHRMGFSYEDIEDLKVAVSEAVTNASVHAYDEDERGEVNVAFKIYEDRLEVIVADKGSSFDIEKVRQHVVLYEKSNSIEEINEGGFGLFLIEALMDEVEIQEDDGIKITMTKFLYETGVGLDGDQISTTP